MWPGLYVNEVGCYLHDTNKPTSKTEIMTIKNKTVKRRQTEIQCVTGKDVKSFCENAKPQFSEGFSSA